MPPSRAALERNLRLFYAVRFLRYLQIWIPVWIVYLTVEQGFSLTQVTTADAMFFMAITLLEVPTGAVADRWGRSVSLGLGALSLAVALAFFAFTTSYAILLVSFMAWALAEALSSGADFALLFDTLKALGREDEYEKHAGRGGAALAAGAALGTLLGGPVAGLTGTRTTILVGVATTLLTAILAFAMTEAPHPRGGEPHPSYLSGLREAFRIVVHRPPVLTILLVGGVMGAGMGAQGYLVQPFLLARGVEVGWLFSMLQVPIQGGFIVGALLAAGIARRWGETVALPLVAVAAVAAFTGSSLTPGLLAVAFFPVVTAMESILNPITTGYVNRRVPSGQRATVLSMHSFARGLVVAPLAPLVGATADARGTGPALGLLGIVVAVGGSLTILAWLRTHRRAGDADLTEFAETA